MEISGDPSKARFADNIEGDIGGWGYLGYFFVMEGAFGGTLGKYFAGVDRQKARRKSGPPERGAETYLSEGPGDQPLRRNHRAKP